MVVRFDDTVRTVQREHPGLDAGLAKAPPGVGLGKALLMALAVAFVGLAFIILGRPGFPAKLFAPTYDGWTVGEVDSCPEPDYMPDENRPPGWDCSATTVSWIETAGAALDRRDPGHSPVVSASIHWQATNGRILCSPLLEIAVFELEDGSKRAVGVGHFCMDHRHVTTSDYGPNR